MDSLCTRPHDVFAFFAGVGPDSPVCQLYLSLPAFAAAARHSALEYVIKVGSSFAIECTVLFALFGARRWRALAWAALLPHATLHPLLFFGLTALLARLDQTIASTLAFFFFAWTMGRFVWLRHEARLIGRRTGPLRLGAAVTISALAAWYLGAFPQY